MESHIRTRGSSKIELDKCPDPMFEKGKYVMAKWRNNVEYLAQVLNYRTNADGELLFHIEFIWDNVNEWYSASNLKPATDDEVKEILEEIRQIKSGDISSSKKSSTEPQPVADENDMIYDPNHTQFQEACRKRRERQRRTLSGTPDATVDVNQNQKSPISIDTPVAPVTKSTPARKPVAKPAVATPQSIKKPVAPTNPDASTKTPIPVDEQPASIPPAKVPPQSFQCQSCPRSFRKQDLLDSHINNYHSETLKPSIPTENTPKKRKQESESEFELYVNVTLSVTPLL